MELKYNLLGGQKKKDEIFQLINFMQIPSNKNFINVTF